MNKNDNLINENMVRRSVNIDNRLTNNVVFKAFVTLYFFIYKMYNQITE